MRTFYSRKASHYQDVTTLVVSLNLINILKIIFVYARLSGFYIRWEFPVEFTQLHETKEVAVSKRRKLVGSAGTKRHGLRRVQRAFTDYISHPAGKPLGAYMRLVLAGMCISSV